MSERSQYYYSDGTISFDKKDRDKVLHRVGGPAITYSHGSEQWYLNGLLHREDGPAIIYTAFPGDKVWYFEGKYHRVGGPAVEHSGNKFWYLNGKLHRDDGSAIDWNDGTKEWWVKGRKVKLLLKKHLVAYMEVNNLTVAHLLVDSDPVLRESAQRYKWK